MKKAFVVAVVFAALVCATEARAQASTTVNEGPKLSNWVKAAQATFVVSQVVAVDAHRRMYDPGPLSVKETAGLRAFFLMNTLVQTTRVGREHPKATAAFLFAMSGLEGVIAAKRYQLTVRF